LALDPENLETICPSCHNKEHPEKGGGKKKVPEKRRKARVIQTKMNEEVW
jgi:5-methylcytosine-specific restriction enzyme A